MLLKSRSPTQTHHLHALHERQSDSHISRQADHTCRSVWCGLQQSHHSFNTHPAGLKSKSSDTCVHMIYKKTQEKRNKNKTKQWIGFITRILSKAEGVPPLWTWPKMVVRVSKPSFFDTSWTEIAIIWPVCITGRGYICSDYWPLWYHHMWLVYHLGPLLPPLQW